MSHTIDLNLKGGGGGCMVPLSAINKYRKYKEFETRKI